MTYRSYLIYTLDYKSICGKNGVIDKKNSINKKIKLALLSTMIYVDSVTLLP